MKPWHVVLGASLLGAGITLGLLVPRTVQQLSARGEQLQRDMERPGTRLAADVNRLKQRLEAHATAVTTRAALAHLERHYGITENRMQRLAALAGRFGA